MFKSWVVLALFLAYSLGATVCGVLQPNTLSNGVCNQVALTTVSSSDVAACKAFCESQNSITACLLDDTDCYAFSGACVAGGSGVLSFFSTCISLPFGTVLYNAGDDLFAGICPGGFPCSSSPSSFPDTSSSPVNGVWSYGVKYGAAVPFQALFNNANAGPLNSIATTTGIASNPLSTTWGWYSSTCVVPAVLINVASVATQPFSGFATDTLASKEMLLHPPYYSSSDPGFSSASCLERSSPSIGFTTVRWTAPSAGTVTNIAASFRSIQVTGGKPTDFSVYHGTTSLCSGVSTRPAVGSCSIAGPISVGAGDVIDFQVANQVTGGDSQSAGFVANLQFSASYLVGSE
jgi:hypothetical protein